MSLDFYHELALYKSFTYLLTYITTIRKKRQKITLKADLFPMTAVARAVDLGAGQLSIDRLQNSLVKRIVVVERTFYSRK